MALPNPGMDFTAFDTLTADQMDNLVENIEALANGLAISGLYRNLLTNDSNPYKASVYRTANQTVPASALTKIQFNGEDFDTNNNFDAVTNFRYTVPVSGFYDVMFRVANNGNGAIFGSLFKNGAEFRDGTLTTIATGRSAVSYGDLVQLTAGDLMEVYVYSDNTTIVGTNTYDTARMSIVYRCKT